MAVDEPPPGPFSIVAPPGAAGSRVDRFLADALGTLSRSRVKALIEEGRASRDGAILRDPNHPVLLKTLNRLGVANLNTAPAADAPAPPQP